MWGGFVVGWVRHLEIGSKWAYGMCFDLQKILDPYLRWFGKYRNMTFAQKCAFLAFFMFFRPFLLVSAYTFFRPFQGAPYIWSKKLTRNRGDTSDTAFESPKSTLSNSEKILTIRTHPEELHRGEVTEYYIIYRHHMGVICWPSVD